MFTLIGALIGAVIDIAIVICLALAILALPIMAIAKLFEWLFRLN